MHKTAKYALRINQDKVYLSSSIVASTINNYGNNFITFFSFMLFQNLLRLLVLSHPPRTPPTRQSICCKHQVDAVLFPTLQKPRKKGVLQGIVPHTSKSRKNGVSENRMIFYHKVKNSEKSSWNAQQ
jgi:hypothetical protein